MCALVLTGAIARTAPVWQMAVLPYTTPDGAKSRGVSRAGPSQAVVASLWPLLLGAIFVGAHSLERWRLLAAVFAAGVIGATTGWRYKVRAGGVTGDFLGATEQLCELATLAVLAWNMG